MFEKFIVSVVIGTTVSVLVLSYIDPPQQSIESPTPITPTIEIRINQDGTMDTTYVYTK